MKRLALVTLLLVAGCGDSDPQDNANTDNPVVGDPGVVHIHGVGVNPRDDALFIAAHTGLFRLPARSKEPTRVADRYQDTMGFTVVGPDRFLGSGHPDGRDGLPPFLGLVSSTDAGESWEPVSLLGKADFHVLEASGQTVYAFGTDWESKNEQLLVSGDGGKTWTKHPTPGSLQSLAVSPEVPDTAIASTGTTLTVTHDAGATWSEVEGPPGLLSWPKGGGPLLIEADGTVRASDGLGSPWKAVGAISSEVAAFDAASPDLLHAGTHEGEVLESRDGGVSWDVRLPAAGR